MMTGHNDMSQRRPLMGAMSSPSATETLGEGRTPADIALAAQQNAKPHLSVPVAAGIACVAACILGGLVLSIASLPNPRLASLPEETGEFAPDVNLRRRWLQDVLAAQKQFERGEGWDPTARKRVTAGSAQATPGPMRAKDIPTGRAGKKVIIEDVADPYYAALFGSAARYAESNAKPSTQAQRVRKAQPSDSAYRGTVLHARLQNEVASDPANTPAVAILSRAITLGKTTWPAGSEVHGIIRGAASAGARVFVEFQFVRLLNGATTNIAGIAQDVSGRAGIAGTRRLTRATAGSVGLATVGRAVNAAGREFAGTAGRVIGAGIEGAVESGSDKAKRLDRDEYVVVVPKGAMLSIYLTDASIDD